ncbi:MAG: hypothetical protein OXH59_05465 [Rhodospirillaceae bacterium]|nr:hypothetical protein [Rhodospirillaceae bacterium]
MERRLNPSVRVRPVPEPAPPTGPPAPPRPAAGKAPKTRAGLLLASHAFAAVICGAILFSDLELHPELKGGMIGVMLRDALAWSGRLYDYFLPQND